MFSRIGSSVCRSSRTTPLKNAVFGGHGLRSSESALENGGLGFLRSYLTSSGAGKQFLKSNDLKEFRNPRLRRLFSSQAREQKQYSFAGVVRLFFREFPHLQWASLVFVVSWGAALKKAYWISYDAAKELEMLEKQYKELCTDGFGSDREAVEATNY